jgi:hypothetical protein
MGDRPFDGHQPLAEILIDRELTKARRRRGLVLNSSLNSGFSVVVESTRKDIPHGLGTTEIFIECNTGKAALACIDFRVNSPRFQLADVSLLSANDACFHYDARSSL